MEILLVGGVFDHEGGRPSGITNKMAYLLKADVFNGGYIHDLVDIYSCIEKYDVVIWTPSIANNVVKLIKTIKINFPKIMLITSKRNNDEYSFQYMINHALGLKSNLFIVFNTTGDLMRFSLYDPLGAEWCAPTSNLEHLTTSIISRVTKLNSITRQGSVPGEIIVTGTSVVEKSLLEYIKKSADIFHDLIEPADNVTRFLGNSSFRCTKGFPSFRAFDDYIAVTKRNIDKRCIDEDAFVYVRLCDDGILYRYSKDKPSVDTLIQVRLYKTYKKICFMIHSHVYVNGAPFTKNSIPCGGLEEVDEITSVITDKDCTDFSVNLIGHGSLIGVSNLHDFKKYSFYARNVPEKMEELDNGGV